MDSPFTGPSQAVQAHWDDLLTDIDALQDQYAAEGWSVTVLHPGEVTPMRGDGIEPALLDVLIPDNELDTLDRLVTDHGFDAVDVYRETADGTVFLVVVLQCAAADTVVIYPAYYNVPDADIMIEEAIDEGVLRVRFRNLADDEAVLVEHPDPDPFFPE